MAKMVRAEESIVLARRSRSSDEEDEEASAEGEEDSPSSEDEEEAAAALAAAAATVAAAVGELGCEDAGDDEAEAEERAFFFSFSAAATRSSASAPSLRCVSRSRPNAHLATTSIVIAPRALHTSIATASVAARRTLAQSTSAPSAISSTKPDRDAELNTLSQIDFSSRCASGSVAPTTNNPFPATRPNLL